MRYYFTNLLTRPGWNLIYLTALRASDKHEARLKTWIWKTKADDKRGSFHFALFIEVQNNYLKMYHESNIHCTVSSYFSNNIYNLQMLRKRRPLQHGPKTLDLKTFNSVPINALTAIGALRALIDFAVSNARRFYSSMRNPLAVKGLKLIFFVLKVLHKLNLISRIKTPVRTLMQSNLKRFHLTKPYREQGKSSLLSLLRSWY